MRSSVVRQLVIWSVLATVAFGCSLTMSFASKGTMPPPGPDGEVDPARAPDFIAVAGREDGIAGYVAKAYLFPEPSTTVGRPDEPDWPVYGEDLRTLVGHMVAGKGFIPLGVDPATVPGFPVEQGPAIDAPLGEPTQLTFYVRNVSPRTAWFVVLPPGDPATQVGFDGGMGVGCSAFPAASQLVLLDRSPADPAARPVRVVLDAAEAGEAPTVWVDIADNGVVSQGQGIPAWWQGGPPRC